MTRNEDFTRKEMERKFRRQVFHISFLSLTVILSAFLLFKLRSLLLPILVGALLAYLFRPMKDRFQAPWMPHEARVLTLFACIGFFLVLGFNGVRKQLPNERQKLELKVRLKYKLNEKLDQVLGKDAGSGALRGLVAKEIGPILNQINRALDLSADERELFMKYRAGFNGEPAIDQRFFEYYQANQNSHALVALEEPPVPGHAPASETEPSAHAATIGASKGGLMEELSIWILAPVIFVFLGFDNGQMRRYFIGLVPNRYFELSLTVMDELDDAIGAYLRGTLVECFLVGLTFAVGLILLGLPFSVSVAIGLISGLANAIPFLGTVIGLVVGLGYALIAENITPLIPGLNANDLALYVVALVAIAHVLDNVIYQPIVLGSAVNLHPLVVVIAIISGSLLLGIWGMLFAIPAVVVLKTAVETLFKELKAYRII